MFTKKKKVDEIFFFFLGWEKKKTVFFFFFLMREIETVVSLAMCYMGAEIHVNKEKKKKR